MINRVLVPQFTIWQLPSTNYDLHQSLGIDKRMVNAESVTSLTLPHFDIDMNGQCVHITSSVYVFYLHISFMKIIFVSDKWFMINFRLNYREHIFGPQYFKLHPWGQRSHNIHNVTQMSSGWKVKWSERTYLYDMKCCQYKMYLMQQLLKWIIDPSVVDIRLSEIPSLWNYHNTTHSGRNCGIILGGFRKFGNHNLARWIEAMLYSNATIKASWNMSCFRSLPCDIEQFGPMSLATCGVISEMAPFFEIRKVEFWRTSMIIKKMKNRYCLLNSCIDMFCSLLGYNSFYATHFKSTALCKTAVTPVRYNGNCSLAISHRNMFDK